MDFQQQHSSTLQLAHFLADVLILHSFSVQLQSEHFIVNWLSGLYAVHLQICFDVIREGKAKYHLTEPEYMECPNPTEPESLLPKLVNR